MTIIEKIKAEIERRKKSLRAGICNEEVFTRRQRTEMLVASEELDRLNRFLSTLESEKPVPNDLDEAAEISFDEAYALTGDYTNFLAKGLTENQPRPIGPHWFCEYAKNRFVTGAKWAREQMMKAAVEGEICIPNVWVEHKEGKELVVRAEISKELGFKFGEKVRVIVLPKED